MEPVSEKVQALIVQADTSEKGNNNGKLDSEEEINIFKVLVVKEKKDMVQPLEKIIGELPKWPIYSIMAPAMAIGIPLAGHLIVDAGDSRVGKKILKSLAGIGCLYGIAFAGVIITKEIWKSDKYKSINDERNKILQEIKDFESQAASVIPDLTKLG